MMAYSALSLPFFISEYFSIIIFFDPVRGRNQSSLLFLSAINRVYAPSVTTS